MNEKRRAELRAALKHLRAAEEALKDAADIVEFERDAEQEAFDNMTEGLQQSERGQAIEANATGLDEAASALSDFDIQDVIGKIEEAIG